MKNAFINADGVLVAHGYMDSNGDDARVEVPDDFDMAPYCAKLVGDVWHEIERPTPVPQQVTPRQARLALLAAGKLAQVDQVIAALPSPQKEAAKIEWEYSTTIERSSSLVAVLGAALKLDDAALDALFLSASTL